ncbi:unknown [Paraprevotella clara CAG:116]|nr:unknown [Paraprevotella clara CAG:116]
MCLGSDENAKIGCKGRRAKGKKVGTNTELHPKS